MAGLLGDGACGAGGAADEDRHAEPGHGGHHRPAQALDVYRHSSTSIGLGGVTPIAVW